MHSPSHTHPHTCSDSPTHNHTHSHTYKHAITHLCTHPLTHPNTCSDSHTHKHSTSPAHTLSITHMFSHLHSNTLSSPSSHSLTHFFFFPFNIFYLLQHVSSSSRMERRLLERRPLEKKLFKVSKFEIFVLFQNANVGSDFESYCFAFRVTRHPILMAQIVPKNTQSLNKTKILVDQNAHKYITPPSM